jgi:hypothetical protein
MKINRFNVSYLFIGWLGWLFVPPAELPVQPPVNNPVAVLAADTLPPAELATATPQRVAYFPDDAALYATLDPGAELLARSMILTNRFKGGNVSFSLSYDRNNWAGYALGPNYSSLFSLSGQPGCYFKIVTTRPSGERVVKEYFLGRGRCFGIFFNRQENCWDLEENPCKRRVSAGR